MPIDFHKPDRRHEPLHVDWRAPPRCCTRPALSKEAAQDDTEGNVRVFALGVLLSISSVITVLLFLKSRWSF
jgi:hypothetical protein